MRSVLPVIVIAQFFCTSVWFAGNSIAFEIVKDLHLDQDFLANLTSAIQLGFISSTLFFAILSISDRFSPSIVFFVSAMFAAFFNVCITIEGIGSKEILLLRLLTGFCLAGIYPVGMKIVSDHYKDGLGKSLGFLVGALVLGTAFPHVVKNSIGGLSWKYVVYATTLLSIIGGLCILLFVPNGPFRKAAQKINLTGFIRGFSRPNFRAASFGYFGHMWELYTFWAFVPAMLTVYNDSHPELDLNVSLLSFLIIASGSIACAVSGFLSEYFGAKKIATIALCLSCLCCVVSPLFLSSDSAAVLITFLVVWGLVVIADSPLFSTLVAQNAPEESRGTSLTIVNCIGFSITIVSIQFISEMAHRIDSRYVYMLLAIGPAFGLVALLNKDRTKSSAPRVEMTSV